jgi:hypothetical protein
VVEANAFKTEVVSVRMSPAERLAVAERADRCGQCLSTYMRRVALGSIPRSRPRRIEQKVVYHLGRIGNNLNQLTRIANTTGRIDLSQRLEAVLNELLQAIRRLI